MVRMSQLKKRLFTGIAIGAGVGVVISGIIGWWSLSTIKSYQNGTNKKYQQLYTKLVTVLTTDVIQGQIIDDTMVKEVRVHNTTVPAGALSKDIVVGSVASYNIPANVPVTSTMVSEDIVDSDLREQELNMVVLPSNLNVGDYIDVRLMYPNGTDYVVLTGKEVKELTEQTMWIDISEDERLLLNGSIVDSYLKAGSKLYATRYIDAATQLDASNQVEGADSNADLARQYLKDQYESELRGIGSASSDSAVEKILDFIVSYKAYSAVVSKTKVNYQPNAQIIQMMNTNPNILQEL